MEPKYKWIAHYSNGKKLSQFDYPEDRSMQAGCQTRSAYYDVDHSILMAFKITDGIHEYLVNLTDASFLVNNIPIRLHSFDEEFSDITLVWSMRHEYTSNGAHRQAYRIGWQGKNAAGRQVQEVIEID